MTIEYRVHPVAALFPMLPDEELRDLADDIKVNGLIHPIVLDADGQLIDGRNRLRACELAGVEPTFEQLDGHDPVAYILSANVNRRHMTKGQRAMAVAVAYPEPEQGKRNDLDGTSPLSGEVKREYLSRARTVLRYAIDLRDPVLAGAMQLNAAADETIKRRDAVGSDEAKLRRLDAEAPDLATMVREERLTLVGALAELAERVREREKDVTIVSDRVSRAVKVALETFADPSRRAWARELFSDERSFLDEPLTATLLMEAAKNLENFAKEWTR